MKSLTGAHYIIKSYSLSHSWTLWWRVRWLKHAVPSWGHGGTAAAMAQNEQTTEEHSTLEQQSSGRLDHPVWCVVWMVWAAYWLRLHSGVLQAMRPRLATTATGARNKAKPQWRQMTFSADKRYMCFQPLYNKCYSDKPLKAKFYWLLEVCINVTTATGGCSQWCIAKNGGGYMQRGVAKGLKVPCLFMITEVSIRCQKNPEVGIRRIPTYTPQHTTGCSWQRDRKPCRNQQFGKIIHTPQMPL